MIIYVMRHGETDWNKKGLLQGRRDIPLNERGRELARITGEQLEEVTFSAVFSSPLKRAEETARLALKGQNIPMTLDERLTEVSFGEDEGKENGYLSKFFTAPADYIPPKGGESFEELHRRTKAFLADIISRDDLEDKTVLVVTHGAASRALLNSLREFDLADFWADGVSKNCSVAILESVRSKVRLIEENKTYY